MFFYVIYPHMTDFVRVLVGGITLENTTKENLRHIMDSKDSSTLFLESTGVAIVMEWVCDSTVGMVMVIVVLHVILVRVL